MSSKALIGIIGIGIILIGFMVVSIVPDKYLERFKHTPPLTDTIVSMPKQTSIIDLDTISGDMTTAESSTHTWLIIRKDSRLLK